MPGVGSGADCLGPQLCAHKRFRLCRASRPGACSTVFRCRFEVRLTVQGEGLAGDGWEQHMMTHEGLALRLLIRSLRLPSWELSAMELALSAAASQRRSALEPRS